MAETLAKLQTQSLAISYRKRFRVRFPAAALLSASLSCWRFYIFKNLVLVLVVSQFSQIGVILRVFGVILRFS